MITSRMQKLNIVEGKMKMKCPYCEGEDNFDNSNIKHKYLHKTETCRGYFKVCPVCETKYVVNNKEVLDKDAYAVSNLYEIDYCINCKTEWLPDFSTSWIRSLTNIEKIYEVMNDCDKIEEGKISRNILISVQRAHNGVLFNRERALKVGFDVYLNGAGLRRMQEYLVALKSFQFLNDEGNATKFTELGKELLSTKNVYEMYACFISAMCGIKVSNRYLKRRNNSGYSYYQTRYVENVLRMCRYNKEKQLDTYIEDIGIALLARNEEDFFENAMKYSGTFNRSGLQERFFGESTSELFRVRGALINIMISIGLLDRKHQKYLLTPIGEDVCKIYEKYPGIWYTNLKENEVEKAAYLMVWRLLSNEFVDENCLLISKDDLQKYINEHLMIDVDTCIDVDFNIYYDIPEENDNLIQLVYEFINNNLMSIEQELFEKMSNLLLMKNYKRMLDIVYSHKEIIDVRYDVMSRCLVGQAIQSGSEWHKKTYDLFKKIGTNIYNYQENPIYNHLLIPELQIYLPGGTNYNPDMIWNTRQDKNILIDAKDANSISQEITKLLGYNIYSHYKDVDSYCIIVLRGNMPQRALERIMDNVDMFDRICIVEENALERMVDSNVSEEKLCELILPISGFKYVTMQDVR